MDALIQDLRYAWRALVRAPGFALAAVLTLGLGIGATTSIYSVVRGVLLKPLPYRAPERLVAFVPNVSAPDLADILAWSHSFAAGGGSVTPELDWTDGDEPVKVAVAGLTGGMFATLGVPPARGRVFDARDDRIGGAPILVVSHGFWSGRLGGDPDVLGRTLHLSGVAYTIVGVMPPGFAVPRADAEAFAPLNVLLPEAAPHRGVHFLRNVLRLAPGATVASAGVEMETIGRRLEEVAPNENTGRAWPLTSLLDRTVGRVRRALWILLGAVLLLLLVACSNFANLLLTRSVTRAQEFAIRSSLGAGRGRLVRQLVTESALLALIGGGLGVLCAGWAVDALVAGAPDSLPRLADIGVDPVVLAFALAVSLGSGIVFGLLPAIQATRGAAETLKQGAAGVIRGPASQRVLGGMVVAQIAMAMILLSGAALIVNGFLRLTAVPPGFDPDHLVAFHVEMPEPGYPKRDTQARFRAGLLERLGRIPGARAAMVSEIPLGSSQLSHNVVIEDQPAPVGQEPEIWSRCVAGDYFAVMEIPILSGRALGADDRDGAPAVAVVNRSFARTYFANHDPLGRRVRWAHGDPSNWITIVGVAGDVRQFGLAEDDAPALYTPLAQFPDDWKRWTDVVVRSRSAFPDLVRPIKAAVHEVDPQIPITRLRTMQDVVSESVDTTRFYLGLILLFAAVAMTLAVIGVFGVTAYAAGRRTRDLGLRMALGASARDVGWLVARHAFGLIGLGIACGVAGALALTGLIATLLYDVPPRDPLTLALVAAAIAAVSLAACVIPARRATRLDPVTALRTE